jgi:hypothetical protein
MKITLALPDQLLRNAEAIAAERGQSLKQFVTEALRDKLALERECARADEPPWMQGSGKLKHLHKETVRVQAIIDEEFGIVEPENAR